MTAPSTASSIPTNRVVEVFGTRHVLLPVVHPVGRAEALASIRVAHDAGVRGVFLIDQGMSADAVLALVDEVHTLYPKLWVGVNLLSHKPVSALEKAWCAAREERLDGVWSDNLSQDAILFARARRTLEWKGLYFGGVAFKYQREVPHAELGRVASAATVFADVICTSGEGTGIAAPVSKLAAMREGIGDHALALASGVTPNNVREYMPFVNAFLVGTGIEARFGELDPRKVEALQSAIARGAL